MKRVIRSVTGALAAIALLSGCGPASTSAGSADSTPSASIATSSQPAPATTAGALTTSNAIKATPAAPKRVAAKAATGGIVINAAGAVLPNHARTPGGTNPSVTQATIGRTICVTGWTATVRPPSSVTTALKRAQLASGYTYKGDMSTSAYEEDHLISLELGGAPSAEANLWPEPYNSPEGARVKDVIENKLHSLVCAGSISLATAQRVIATNWSTAYQAYVGAVPRAASYRAPAAIRPPPAPAPAGGTYYANCTAVRAAGAAPILRGQPGYSSKLDRDGDGIGCE
jgi:Excalibur calcium-binding domain